MLLSFAVFLAVATVSVHSSAVPCLCSGLQVNCSSLNLVNFPHLQRDTTELHVQDNRLTAVSPGLLDGLVHLRRVSLSGNPFHCDCRIQYLRTWLQRNRDVVYEDPTCASPSSLAHTAVADLPDDLFVSCGLARCSGWTYNMALGLAMAVVIVLLLWSFRLVRTCAVIMHIEERHWGFEADSLRSLKPRHRRRVGVDSVVYTEDSVDYGEDSVVYTEDSVDYGEDSVDYGNDLAYPLINTELLPQVLDTLHKKHNIKIKAT